MKLKFKINNYKNKKRERMINSTSINNKNYNLIKPDKIYKYKNR